MAEKFSQTEEDFRVASCKIQKDDRFHVWFLYTKGYPCIRCGLKPTCNAHMTMFVKTPEKRGDAPSYYSLRKLEKKFKGGKK